MAESDYYNDGGKDDCCTDCGKPIVFIDEETKMLKSGNLLYPEIMPFKERPTKIKKWSCLACGATGQNMYLVTEKK